jgi:hypothetical protein
MIGRRVTPDVQPAPPGPQDRAIGPAAAAPPKPHEPYGNEVVKRWATQRELSQTGRRDPFCLARKRIANCKPIDRMSVSHVLRVECAGAGMERSRDDERIKD